MSYLEWHKTIPTVLEAVRCKDCGAPLVVLTRTDHLIEKRIINGVHKEWYYAVMAATPSYTTYTVPLDDGSAMQVPICKECALNVKTEADEALLVQAGIEALEDEAVKFSQDLVFINRLKQRRPQSRGGAR